MIKLLSKNIANISIQGVALKAKQVAGGYLLEVEDEFKHVETLLSHGFKVVEDEVAALIRPRSAGAGTGAAGTEAQTGAAAVQTSASAPAAPAAPVSTGPQLK